MKKKKVFAIAVVLSVIAFNQQAQAERVVISDTENVTVDSTTLGISDNSTTERGSAFHNSGTLNIIDAFIKNNKSDTHGAAIFNQGTLNVSNSEFSKNKGTSNYSMGGAIFNKGIATVTNSKFINNESSNGSAIYNQTNLTVIGSEFIGNSINPNNDAWESAAAIDNNDQCEVVLNVDKSTFKDNINKNAKGGGAIYFGTTSSEQSKISNSEFTSNEAIKSNGGAINIYSGDLLVANSDFNSNTAINGGAIFNQAKLEIDGGNFNQNNATLGGALYVTGANSDTTISNSNFNGNTASSQGGAIVTGTSSGNLSVFNSEFNSNTSKTGGAISAFSYKQTLLDNVKFNTNSATSDTSSGGGALFVGGGANITIRNAEFNENTSAGVGGAIATRDGRGGFNEGTLIIENTSFNKNSATGDGGAIWNAFHATPSGADSVILSNVTFDGNSSGQNGGAIYNAIGDANDANAYIDITNASFTNNSAQGNGGAIFSYGDVTINAIDKNVLLSGNTDSTGGNDIYMAAGADSSLNINATDGSKVTVASGIAGSENYTINMSGLGTFDLQSAIKNAATVNIDSGSTLLLNTGSDVSGVNSVIMSAGSILSTANGQVDDFTSQVGKITTKGDITVNVDVNMETGTADQIGTILADNATVSIGEISSLSSSLSTTNGASFNLFNALGLTQEQISNSSIQNAIVNDVMTPIRRLSGSVSEDGTITYSPSGNTYNDFNSAVMASSVAAQLNGYFTQLNSYQEAFRNMDSFMLMTKSQRAELKNANRYAVVEQNNIHYADVNKAAGYINPYAVFESVKLKDGPKVSNVMYGTYFGLDSEMYDIGKGWDGILSIYAGYNGSHQAYQGNSIFQNGGTLGITGVAYKGNFFTGLTANIGSSVGDIDTKYGSEDFTMLMTGIASKSGYNYEFADGKFIIQPSLMVAYSMVNTFDYTNAAGVRIKPDALHNIHFEPGIKFIGNLANGWQPYVGVSVIMNAMDDTKFKANDVSLPELSIKPYAKYGVGVKKTWGERFTGFLQAFITSGGRDGIGLHGGFKWELGKKDIEKVQLPSEKKYIKAQSKTNTII